MSRSAEEARIGLNEKRNVSAKWLKQLTASALPPRSYKHLHGDSWLDPATGAIHRYGFVKPPRPARCSWAVGAAVSIKTKGGKAHYGGVESCASIWACPVCAAYIRQQRAVEIQKAVLAHQQEGGAVLFMTLTLRHKKGDALATTLDAVLEGWRGLIATRLWKKRLKEELAITGYIRAVEVTYGRSGWHPHAHILIFLARDIPKSAVEMLGDEVYQAWADSAVKRTGRKPTRQHGVDIQKVDSKGRVLAKYLAKLDIDKGEALGRWGVDRELARSDIKAGRSSSITPYQLLDGGGVLELPQGQCRALWQEYYQATHGRRCITWARGLKARYAVAEKTDEELLHEEEGGTVVWVASTEAYRAINRNAELRARALSCVEQERWGELAEILPGSKVELAEPGTRQSQKVECAQDREGLRISPLGFSPQGGRCARRADPPQASPGAPVGQGASPAPGRAQRLRREERTHKPTVLLLHRKSYLRTLLRRKAQAGREDS